MNKNDYKFTYIYLAALVLVVSACSPSEATAVPVEVTFETPTSEITGGIRLEAPEPSWDGYGEAVDVYDDVLVIGAPEWNPCGHGSAYVYRVSGREWQLEAQLIPSDRDDFEKQARRFEGQRFGSSVTVGEGIIAIGAPGNVQPAAGEPPGAVYLYEYDGQAWIETAKLTPDPLDLDAGPSQLETSACGRMRPKLFGSLVALDGNTLAVGGDARDLVYIYQGSENGWQEQAQIPIPEVSGRDLYMASMALTGDTLALSALYTPPQPKQAPALSGNVVVYVFERADGVWQESFRFEPEGQTDIVYLPEVNVGASVALGGESGTAILLAVGLPGFPEWSEVKEHDLMFGADPARIPEFPESNRQYGAVYLVEQVEGIWSHLVILKPAGWENPPGPGNPFATFPSHPEGEQSDADEAAFYTSIIFPGHIFSEAPEISFFGATVDLDGDQLAVTAGFSNATYVFERQDEDWVYQFSITPVNEKVELWEDYAQVVRISGHTLLLGTPSEFGNSAYVFSLSPIARHP
jgi:hypothetical protein